MAEFVWPVRVYIEDTDAGGIVYYINYLKFMERARTEFMRTLGYGKQFIFDQQAMFVVHSAQVNYKSSACLDDNLRVSATPLKIARTYILFEQQVFRDDQLLCDADIKVAYVARDSMKPKAIPAEVLQTLKNAAGLA